MEVIQRRYQPLANYLIPEFTGPATATKTRLTLIVRVHPFEGGMVVTTELSFFLLLIQRIPHQDSLLNCSDNERHLMAKTTTGKLARQSNSSLSTVLTTASKGNLHPSLPLKKGRNTSQPQRPRVIQKILQTSYSEKLLPEVAINKS